MTADEVLEAMARAAAEAAHRMPWSNIPAMGQEQWLDCIRAAIRALPPGWVVAKVSEDAVCTEGSSEIEWAWVSGANHAYAAVRASAVEVE